MNIGHVSGASSGHTFEASVKRRRGAGAALAVALLAGGAMAQQSMHQPVISLDWRGGTVEEYVAALRGAARETVVNVVVDPDIVEWDVAPVRLAGVTALQAVQAGAAAARGDGEGRVVVEDQTARGPDAGAGFAVMSAVRRGRAERPTELGVLPLRSLVEPLPGGGGAEMSNVEAVLSAVEACINLADMDGLPAQMQFHQASYLLMVQGDASEIEAASRVVSLLTRDMRERREHAHAADAALLEERVRKIADATSGDAEAAVVELNAERRRMELMHEQARLGLEGRKADVERKRQLHERGMVSTPELQQAEIEMQRATLEAEMVQSEIQRVDDRLLLAQTRAQGDSEPALQSAINAVLSRLELSRAAEGGVRARLEDATARKGIDVSPADIERLNAELARVSAERAELESRLAQLYARRKEIHDSRQEAEDRARAAAAEAELARRQVVELETRLQMFERVVDDERRARLEAEEQLRRMVVELTQVRVHLEALQAERAKPDAGS